ncbi:MAG: MFS transporter, partial [Gaiellaceae bacterium]
MAVAFRLQLRTVAAVAREPKLLCLELSWGGHYLAEWTSFVALSIYAYNHGGASAVGVFGLLRMGAAAIALPFGSVFTDRYPRQRVLIASHAARAAALGATAGALAAHEPRSVVFALAAVAAVVAAPIRPATMSLTPLLARTSRELVAANVCSSAVEGLATLAGPVLGGALTASAGAATAVGVASAVSLAAAAAAAGARHAAQVAVRATAGRGLDALLQGVRTLRRDPQPRLIVLLFASQTFVRGLLNVELTVA